LVAPVALGELDPVAREDLAAVESDDCHLLLIDDGENSTTGMGRAGI
jgi:hypothetical protein